MRFLHLVAMCACVAWSCFAHAAAIVAAQDECTLTLSGAPELQPKTPVSLERPNGTRYLGNVLLKNAESLIVKILVVGECPALLSESLEVSIDESRRKSDKSPQRKNLLGNGNASFFAGYTLTRSGKPEGEVAPYQTNLWYDTYEASAVGRYHFSLRPDLAIPVVVGFGWLSAAKPFTGTRKTVSGGTGGLINYEQNVSVIYARFCSGIVHALSARAFVSAQGQLDYGLSGELARSGGRTQNAKLKSFLRYGVATEASYLIVNNIEAQVLFHVGGGSFSLASAVDKTGAGPFPLLNLGAGIGLGMRF